MRIVLDANVAVAAVFPGDPNHAAARARLRGVIEGHHELFLPSVFMAEVVSGARRQGNPALGLTAARDIAARATLKSITPKLATSAGEIIATVPLRGFDAIYVQVAIEFNATLITSDQAVLTHAPCKVAAP